MGGEPFLRKDFFQIGQAVKDLGMDLSIVSNGTMLVNHLSRLSTLEPKVIGISLDGMKEHHEAIRGNGTWDKTVNSIEKLREAGLQTTVITTVSRINFRDLIEMRKLIKGKGIGWQIQVAMPFGNFQKDNVLSPEDFYATAMFIAKERVENAAKDMPVVGAHCYGYYSEILPGCGKWNGCTAGISTIGITSDGGITGCLSLGNDRFLEGNVRKGGLRGIWEDSGAFSYNRKFTIELLGQNCADCKHAGECKGGCNSVSYCLTGKFHNDSYCFHAIERKLLKVRSRGYRRLKE